MYWEDVRVVCVLGGCEGGVCGVAVQHVYVQLYTTCRYLCVYSVCV